MSVVSRGLRNLSRKRARTIGVSLIVGLSLAIFLSLEVLNAEIAEQNASLQSNASQILKEVEDIITVQPAGGHGFFAPGTVNDSVVPLVENTSHVSVVQRMLLHIGGSPGTGGPTRGNFYLVEGLDLNGPVTLYGSGSITLTSGRNLTVVDMGKDNAMVGSSIALHDNAGVNGTILVNGTAFNVVGVFTSGTTFGDEFVIVPYPAAQAAYQAAGPNLLYVTADSVADVNPVVSTLRSTPWGNTTLGSAFDITSLSAKEGPLIQYALSQIEATGNTIEATSEFGAYAALAIGAAVVIFVMMMTVAERTREVGLLKALGFRNGRIVSQLVLESFLISVIGFGISLVVALWIGPVIDNLLLRSGRSGAGPIANAYAGGYLGTAGFSLTPEAVALAAVVTVTIAVLASLYPIFRAIRLKPSEALRHE